MTTEVQSEIVHISRDDLRDLIREETEAAAEVAVRKVLTRIGISTKDDDAQAEAYEDFRSLRRWRKSLDAAASLIGRTIIVLALGAVLGAMWIGTQAQLGRPPHP